MGRATSPPVPPGQGVRLVVEGIVWAAGLGVSMKPGTGGQGGNQRYMGVSGLVLVGVVLLGCLHLPASMERETAGSLPREEVAVPSWR